MRPFLLSVAVTFAIGTTAAAATFPIKAEEKERVLPARRTECEVTLARNGALPAR